MQKILVADACAFSQLAADVSCMSAFVGISGPVRLSSVC